MPHIETGEFANIGVVLVAPQIGYLDYRIETRRHGRITNFFDTLKPEFFRNATTALIHELDRVRKMLPDAKGAHDFLNIGYGEPYIRLFREVTRPREGIINFGGTRVVLSDDPRTTLKKLFGHYVERDFVTQRYPETLLEQQLKRWLDEKNLGGRFVKKKFDDGLYRASFPFVEMDVNGRANKIIKPFFLGQTEPTAIIDHGVKWATSVRRLRSAKVIPQRILFAVEGPSNTGPQRTAFRETRELLEDSKIDVLPFDNQAAILKYAAAA